MRPLKLSSILTGGSGEIRTRDKRMKTKKPYLHMTLLQNYLQLDLLS
jgi:hypothetical protein